MDALYNLVQDIELALSQLTAQYGLFAILSIALGVPIGAALLVAVWRSFFGRDS